MKKIACIFSGQGSQYVGMGKDLYESFPLAKKLFETANKKLGFDIAQICFNGPEDALVETKNQQLAIVTVSAICFSLIRERISPMVCAGLSLGEYTALWAAGCIQFEDMLELVRERSLAMQEAAQKNPSTMVAVVDVPIEKIEQVCHQVKNTYIANVNSPAQVVVSLAKDTVDSFVAGIAQLGVGRTVVLSVSGGFHSPFMRSAESRLKQVLSRISFDDARIPVISNIDAKQYTQGNIIRENLLKQLTGKVLWKDSLISMIDMAEEMYELGPSRILKGLLRKFERKLEVTTVGKKEEIEAILKVS